MRVATADSVKTKIEGLIAQANETTGNTDADLTTAVASLASGYVDLTSDTVTADKMLSPYTAHDANGDIITGTIPTKTHDNISVSGPTITVPSGYYSGSYTKVVANTDQATPSISVNSSGLITASSTQSEGYVAAGTKSATKQLTTQEAKTVTPSTANQTAVASRRYTTGAVTVKGDANLIADNIKSGTSIFGVTGSYVDSTPIEISTEAGMEAVLTSSNVGKVYKFTGTSGTYTNGDLYVVEVG